MSEMISLNLKEYQKPEITPELQAEIDLGFRKESFWAKRIPGRLKEKITTGLALGMTLMGPVAVEAQSGGDKPKEETKISSSTEREWPGAHWDMFTRGADGEEHFNPYAFLFPQVEFGSKTTEQEKVVFDIPYEYSRLFDTGKPLNAEDHEKLAKYIDQKLKQEFADKLSGFEFTKDVYKAHHGETSNKPRVTGLSITGLSSPEGPQSKGQDTLKPGNVDDENLNLAMKRAEVGMGLTEEGLKKLGITLEQLENSAKMMGARETQFNDAEMSELAGLAAGEDGADPLEKIFHLTIKYNDGEIKDPAVLSKLDEMVGSKRKVKVTIKYEADQKKVVLIPVPWMVFLPLLKLRKKKDEGQQDLSPEPKSEPGPKPKPPKPEIPVKIKDIRLPSQDSFEYQDMEERASIDDLYEFFENSDAIKRGLDYESIADSVYLGYEDFDDDQERENFLTLQILKGWRVHDLAARREAGVSEENLGNGLDYENNDDQIRWAKMHAKALSYLVVLKRQTENGKNVAYLDLMETRVQRLILRRVSRNEGPVNVQDPVSNQPTSNEAIHKELTLEEIEAKIKFAKDTGLVPGIGPEGLSYWEEQKKLYLEKNKEEKKIVPSDLTLEEIERRIKFAKDTGRVPGIGPEGLSYWEDQKKLYLKKHKGELNKNKLEEAKRAKLEKERQNKEEKIQSIKDKIKKLEKDLSKLEQGSL